MMEYIEQGCRANSFNEIEKDVDTFYNDNFATSEPNDLDSFCTEVTRISNKYNHQYWALKEAAEEEMEDFMSAIDMKEEPSSVNSLYASFKEFREAAIKTEWLSQLESKLLTAVNLADQEGRLYA